MTTSVQNSDTAVRTALQDDLLCIADTKLVLGNWFAECVMNGKSLPDFAAMLGMCTASYGQTRAIYRHLDTLDHSYRTLETGRGPGEIRSTNLLDVPPQGWPDFLVTTWLAELATWSMASGFLQHSDRTIAGICRKIGEEAYFHLKYAVGWFRIMESSPVDREGVRQSLELRYPLALQWFGPDNSADLLHEAGQRDDPIADIRAGFIAEVTATLAAFESELAPGREPALGIKPTPQVSFGSGWRPEARREGALPPGLFEVIRFKDSDLAR
jgi:1,2-phenylacetyl-CoA epoxidase catalytic subunit